ncbi:chromosome segregation protein SMC [Candidatus Clostridium stratigraminis]|uniref:Chromosome partition protein Smc n=1 Tax=Candidatus Clostridium stratigraminis TaxID=3381661 RepID=A0ABW8T3F6_9CLOT
MFLKSIEIRGFKSFAEKTNLSFKKGVTSVVGPNGSGKSNISDAVRWVLGEQSVKSLRGGKMEDVIFAGTQYRKPVGLAQVSLALDNSDEKLPIDYSDVIISRRLYRSGESEYYINNTQCRLKDIQELFMDTGIGKEGYSIIGQGKIDAILSGKPEERRSLLEEAAGIVKYKSRKDDAEKKLQSTEQNLIRIIDIINTFEERLEPLRIQSEKAKEFLKLSSNLTEKEANLIIHSIDISQNKINSVTEKINDLKVQISNILISKEISSKKLEELNHEFEEHNAKLQDDQKEYYKAKSLYQTVTSENTLLEERVKNLKEIIDKNILEINKTDEKLKSLVKVKEEQENNLLSMQKEMKQLDETIISLEEEILKLNDGLKNDEAYVSELKNNDTEVIKSISTAKNSILLMENERLGIENKIRDLKVSTENFINSIKINSSTIIIIDESINNIKTKSLNSENDIKKNKLEISKLNTQLTKDERLQKELNVNLNKTEANYHMLSSLEKQYEGYNKAVKSLMQEITAGKISKAENRCFILGEIIEVGKQYEVSMEIALGGAISDIITEDENIATYLINHLKTNNLGRATFLPLNIVKGKKIQNIESCSKLEGYLGIASELIKYDAKFTNAIEFILGRTIIAKDMTYALKIAKATGYSYKIVTLSGEVINSGGSLTGGSTYHKSTNVISRKREIQELQDKLKNINLSLEEAIKNVEELRAFIKKLDETNLNLRDEIYKDKIETTRLQGEISSITNENNKLNESLERCKKEIDALENEVNNFDVTLSEKEASLKKLIDEEALMSIKINELTDLLKNKNVEIIEVKEKNTSLKIKKAQKEEIINNKIRELSRLANDTDETLIKNKHLQEENELSQNSLNTSLISIEENINKAKSIEQDILSYEEYFKASEAAKISIKDKISTASNELDNIVMDLNKNEDEYHKQELSITKLQAELDGLYGKLNDEMSLTYAEAIKYRSNIENIEEYKKAILKTKADIASLGLVNVGAIEEYKEVQEKYLFMSSQREDLIEAKSELVSMIHEMTEKMKSVFSENLNILRGLFNETFRELFKGGSADLIIANGDELTSNIEINVEPPGKKLQNINLMSGGEKVLSAIALLFAILKMKPTPFCILDEIEAALDDANVLRYAEFLKKFSDNIQFIVITHRKGTMEVSDILYGVTMEEKGVSKVVSVDLNKHPN